MDVKEDKRRELLSSGNQQTDNETNVVTHTEPHPVGKNKPSESNLDVTVIKPLEVERDKCQELLSSDDQKSDNERNNPPQSTLSLIPPASVDKDKQQMSSHNQHTNSLQLPLSNSHSENDASAVVLKSTTLVMDKDRLESITVNPKKKFLFKQLCYQMSPKKTLLTMMMPWKQKRSYGRRNFIK